MSVDDSKSLSSQGSTMSTSGSRETGERLPTYFEALYEMMFPL